MKGPKKIEIYVCDDCDYICSAEGFDTCDLFASAIFDQRTPSDCPFRWGKEAVEAALEKKKIQDGTLIATEIRDIIEPSIRRIENKADSLCKEHGLTMEEFLIKARDEAMKNIMNLGTKSITRKADLDKDE